MHSPPHGSLLHFTIHLSFSAFHLIFQLLNLLGQFLCLFGFLLRFFLCLIQNPKAAWTSSAVTPTPLYRVLFFTRQSHSLSTKQITDWVHLLGLFVDLLFVLTSRAVGSLFSLVNALILHWFNPVPPKLDPAPWTWNHLTPMKYSSSMLSQDPNQRQVFAVRQVQGWMLLYLQVLNLPQHLSFAN
jgi:hypothetical protein